MPLIALKLAPVMVAPSVPASTMIMADGLMIAMTFDPSIVGPRKSAPNAMTMPMTDEAFMVQRAFGSMWGLPDALRTSARSAELEERGRRGMATSMIEARHWRTASA